MCIYILQVSLCSSSSSYSFSCTRLPKIVWPLWTSLRQRRTLPAVCGLPLKRSLHSLASEALLCWSAGPFMHAVRGENARARYEAKSNCSRSSSFDLLVAVCCCSVVMAVAKALLSPYSIASVSCCSCLYSCDT